jgi:VWFA-related protein
MFGSSHSYLALAAALLVGPMTGAAQQQAAPQVSQPETAPQAVRPPESSVLHTRTGPPVRTIHLDVVVTSKPGQPVTGLEQKDFTLLDDKTPREITSFEAVDVQKEPVQAILLIDAVNTGYTEISQERIQIDKFLRANGGKLALPTTLAVFGDQGIKMQAAYTRDGNVLAESLGKYTIGLREIGRSAGFEGAEERLDDSLKAIRMLAAYALGRPGRKIILWVSPGWPLLSGPGINLTGNQRAQIFSEITWLSAVLRESQTSVYAIDPLGVGESVAQAFYYQQFTAPVRKPSDDNMGNLGLQVLATETGGLVLNSTDISALLREAVGDNVAYYRLSFEPPATEKRDVYHSLKVTVAKPGLTVATSTGYYAEP